MKIYATILTVALFATVLLTGCGHGSAVEEYLAKSDKALDCAALPLAVPEKVCFKTDDGGELFADYYPGKGENPAGVLLVHDYYDDRRCWDALIDDLVAKGYAVLAPDLRGHGESITETPWVGYPSGPGISPEEFKTDISTALRFLVNKGIPGDKTVAIVSGRQLYEILLAVHNYKGAVCLLSQYVPKERPSNWYYYFYSTGVFDISGPFCIPPPASDFVRVVSLEHGYWLLFEVRTKNPAETAAQAEILRSRFEAMDIRNTCVRAKDDGTIQIITPERHHYSVMSLLTPCKLEFKTEAPKDVHDRYAKAYKAFVPTKSSVPPPPPEGYEFHKFRENGENKWILVEAKPSMTADDFKDFFATEDSTQRPAIGFRLHESAKKRFGDLTADLNKEGRRLTVVLDDQVIFAPGVMEAIKDGRGVISMGAWENRKCDISCERDRLLASLNSGILAVKRDKPQTYLIVSMRDDKAKIVGYPHDILGRKIGDFDVNENILRDIEAILAEKK